MGEPRAKLDEGQGSSDIESPEGARLSGRSGPSGRADAWASPVPEEFAHAAAGRPRAAQSSGPGSSGPDDFVGEEVTEGQVLEREEAGARPTAAAAGSGSRVGQMLANRYRLERLIAKGGMGRVYLATQLPLERRVAVKLLVAKAYDDEFRQRFFLEASTCARLVHRHIVTVHDYGEAENGELFMAMEYLDGEPLSKVISHEIRIPSERACQIALQICRALRTAHKAGIVHRDLKPGNIMLLRDEDHEQGDFIKVLDFGLVKAFQRNEESPTADLTRSGTWLGSPRYMAPEQIRCRDVDPRTDIYSLGVILFHMVAGRPPFVGANSVEILEQHLRDPVPSIRDTVGQVSYAPELEVIIRKCMEKDPANRYQSMDDLIPQLKAAFRLATGVSIHTESSLPIFGDPAEGQAETSGSGKGSVSSLRPALRAETLSTRPPPVPELGPPPDLGFGLAEPDLVPSDPTPTHDLSERGRRADPSDLPTPAPRSSKRGLLIALALLGVLLASFAITRLMTPERARGPGAPAVQEILVAFSSTPSGAEVVGPDGAVLGTTPFELHLSAEARGSVRRYVLRRAGYEDVLLEARLDREQVALQAVLTPRLAAPAPEVAPSRPAPAVVERPQAAPAPARVTARAPSRRPPTRGAREPSRSETAPPEAPPTAEETPSIAPKVAPPSRTVDSEPRPGLVVDEDEGSAVKDRAIPVVD